MPNTVFSSDVSRDGSAPPALVPARDSLFLDLDGTLAAIEATPDLVTVAPSMRLALGSAVKALDRRVAVVSGRSLDDVERLVDLPVICLAGIHGLERRLASGKVARAIPSPGLEKARAELAALGRRLPQLLIEDKGLGIAVHFRLAPNLAGVAEQAARAVADANGLVLQPGKMVFEVREHGADKGVAVLDFMAAPPFSGSRPIFVGDDDTDEVGFEAARHLGGYGVLVGPPRATAADFRLPDVAALQRWLEAIRRPG